MLGFCFLGFWLCCSGGFRPGLEGGHRLGPLIMITIMFTTFLAIDFISQYVKGILVKGIEFWQKYPHWSY